MMTRHPCRHLEYGQTSIEYTGITVAVVALIVATIGMTSSYGQTYICKIESAISKIGGTGSASVCSSRNDDSNSTTPKSDSKKPNSCTVSSTNESIGLDAKVVFVKIGGALSMATQEERYVDPDTGEMKTKYTATAVDEETLGVTAGVGGKGKVGKMKLGVDLSGGEGVTVKSGDSWEFDSKEEMEQFINNYKEYKKQQAVMSVPGVNKVYEAYKQLDGGLAAPPRSPDFSGHDVKVSADGNADAGVRTKGKQKGKHSDKDRSRNLNAGVYLEAEGGNTWSEKTDNRKGHEGERVTTVSYEGSYEAGVNAVVVEGSNKSGGFEGSMSRSYDKDGKLVSITFTQADIEGESATKTNGPINGDEYTSGSVSDSDGHKVKTVSTTTLPVTDQNRTVVEQWIQEHYDPWADASKGRVPTIQIPPGFANPDSPNSSDPMLQLMYEEATNTQTVYDISSGDFSIGAQAGVIGKGGLTYSNTKEGSKIVSQTYLSEPPAKGAKRSQKVMDLCTK